MAGRNENTLTEYEHRRRAQSGWSAAVATDQPCVPPRRSRAELAQVKMIWPPAAIS